MPAPADRPNNIVAILWMVGAAVSFSALVVAVRELSVSLPTAEILFFRAAFSVTLLLPWLGKNGLAAVATRRPLAHTVRCLMTFTAMMLWFHGVGLAALADAVAIQSTYPLFTILLATMFLGERPQMWRLAAAGVGFFGMLIIVRPGMMPVGAPTLMLLGSAVCYAISSLFIRWLSSTEPPNRMVFIQNAALALLSAAPMLYYWVDPEWSTLPWIAMLGLSGLSAHMCMARALTAGQTSVVMPFDYLRLPFAALLGFLLYLEVPDGPTIVGGLVIFAAAAFLAGTERRAA